MSITKVNFKDQDGFHYKHPERSCKNCKKHPCVSNMDNLKGDFAKYGCINFQDVNIFNTWKPKR